MPSELTRAYVYFRFYTPDSEIAEVLTRFCGARWRSFTPAGYNVKEYQCECDNIGGLSVAAASLHGYILPDRETGFIDSAPSSDVVNLAMKMATYQTRYQWIPRINLLHNDNLIIRKVVADNATGDGKLDIDFGGGILEHPFYYSYDSTTIEIVEKTGAIIDSSSDVSNISVYIDHNTLILPPPSHHFTSNGLNVGNMWDDDHTTSGLYTHNTNTPYTVGILDQPTTISRVGVYGYREAGDFDFQVYTSPDDVTYTLRGSDTFTGGHVYHVISFSPVDNVRYLKISAASAPATHHIKVINIAL